MKRKREEGERRSSVDRISSPQKTYPLARNNETRVVNNNGEGNRISGFTASFLKRAKAKMQKGESRVFGNEFCRPNFRRGEDQRGIRLNRRF